MRLRSFDFLKAPYLVLILGLLAGNLLMPLRLVTAAPARQSQIDQAADLLQRLRPEERIGQLFLITFQGTKIEPGTPIYELITSHHVGGVVLLAQNNNLMDSLDSPTHTITELDKLVQRLQRVEWEHAQETMRDSASGQTFQPSYVPLWIGIAQEGNGYPTDQILHGLTTMPSAMAIGSSWSPNLAVEAGKIVGQELSTLGINLLFGPSLDVLESPQIGLENNLGTRTFGGDPYWVGEMGRAYVRGVHQGSQGRMALIAKFFPGHGSSDRLPEQDVATVRKSLEELQNYDLMPFFAVTDNAASPEDIIDALLTSHIRYQGLQGNIRATTRPVSFDPQALSLLLGLQPLSEWRSNGGLMISDDLGSRAVRRFYDLTSQSFDARRVALNAFLAGNDLLYVADFTSIDEADPLKATLRTLDFFVQKYREDAAFAQRVDDSVLRILALKLRLYQDFSLSSVLANPGNLSDLGKGSQVTFQIARQAATLISPSLAELDETIPDPPNQNDRIVFLNDVRYAQQCSECPIFPILDVRTLQDAVLRLYGPQSGGLITPNNLTSYTLSDLKNMLDGARDSQQLERDLLRANWIVFTMLDANANYPSFTTLSRFLTERPDLFQQKRLIVFALTAPYFLDATDTSKLTAYFGLYSKAPPFIDMAAYLLFGEQRPLGAPSVSVAGIGYDLNEALFPNPEQIIPLEIDLPQPPLTQTIPVTATLQPSPPPEFRVGDFIPLIAGPVLDHNGNYVPDGTPVSFIFAMGNDANLTRQVETTRRGVARTTYSITTPGVLAIRVESENARSDTLRLDITSPLGGTITPETPTPPVETPTQAANETPLPTPATPLVQENTPLRPSFSDWLIAVFLSTLVSVIAYRLAALSGHVRWGVRAAFLAFISGMLAYTYLALRLPGSPALLESDLASRYIFIVTLAGSLIGLLLTVVWRAFRNKEMKSLT